FDGVLGGEHGEVRGETIALAIDGDGALLHGLEQRRLRFGGGAVNFIGQQERGEEGAFEQRKLIALEVEYVVAGDIGGHEVGSELDALELGAEHGRQGAGEQGFSEARYAFYERVLIAQDDYQR